MDLKGKACIVTGATKGIGRSIAQALAGAGADVVVSARTAGDVESVMAELDRSNSGRMVGVPADVSRADECSRLIGAAVQELGRLDVLINNAGVGIFASIEELSLDDWQTQIDTNLRGVFCCAQAAVPHLKATKGWINQHRIPRLPPLLCRWHRLQRQQVRAAGHDRGHDAGPSSLRDPGEHHHAGEREHDVLRSRGRPGQGVGAGGG